MYLFHPKSIRAEYRRCQALATGSCDGTTRGSFADLEDILDVEIDLVCSDLDLPSDTTGKFI